MMTFTNRNNPFSSVRPFHLVDSLLDVSNRAAGFQSAVDVEINPAKAVLRFDLPGVPREKIELNLEDGALCVRGEREAAALDENGSYWTNERRTGRFERRFRLGEEFDPASVEASLKDGVLTVEVARKAQTQPQRIEVK